MPLRPSRPCAEMYMALKALTLNLWRLLAPPPASATSEWRRWRRWPGGAFWPAWALLRGSPLLAARMTRLLGSILRVWSVARRRFAKSTPPLGPKRHGSDPKRRAAEPWHCDASGPLSRPHACPHVSAAVASCRLLQPHLPTLSHRPVSLSCLLRCVGVRPRRFSSRSRSRSRPSSRSCGPRRPSSRRRQSRRQL